MRFRIETVTISSDLSMEEEKLFLNNVIESFKLNGADVIIPSFNNTIFSTFQNGAYPAPYGSYIINLTQSDVNLWHNINKSCRQNINIAKTKSVRIIECSEESSLVYSIIKDIFRRSKIRSMDFLSSKCFVCGFGEYCKILIAEYKGNVRSTFVFSFSKYCAYVVYTGNIVNQQTG